jgi:2',3'-cyclic-nucleotide 2'-phosphodiesterase (5'-nucleotidase family)
MRTFAVVGVVLGMVAGGCVPPGPDRADAGVDGGTTGEVDAGGGADAGRLAEVTILHTSDEHGWLVPFQDGANIYGGAANVVGWWRELEGLDPSRHLVLSGGDNWTGPAISTWFKGKPVVEVFNQMGYRAVSLGNHEFDFGQEELRARVSEAGFPFLGANVFDAETGLPADFVSPYAVVEVSGVKVGIVGLVTTSASTSTNPRNVTGLRFEPFARTLAWAVPEVRAAGAEIVVILAHEELSVMLRLADTLAVPVDAIFAAHGHELGYELRNGIPVVGSGTQFMAYSVTRLVWDRVLGAVVETDTRQEVVAYPARGGNFVTPDPAVEALVEGWQARADQALSEELGYTATGVRAMTWTMGNWVADAWRWAFPGSDITIQNFGGLRQDVPPGVVTLQDIVSMQPFNNQLFELSLTGAQVVQNLAGVISSAQSDSCWPAVSGIRWTGHGDSLQVRLEDGAPIGLATRYRVIVSDYVYYGGCGYQFYRHDGTPQDTGKNEREPVVDFTRQLETTAQDPLERHLDGTPRGG